MADQAKLGGKPSDDSNFAMIRDGVASYLNDSDPEETNEWMDSLDGLLQESSPERARYLMLRLLERASAKRVSLPPMTSTDYVNTIPTSMEPEFPGDEEMEKRYRRWIRWNAAIMVHRAQRPGIGVGGHISTYAGAALCTKLASTTSSAARITQAAATRSSSRATHHQVCTHVHSWRVAFLKTISMASVRKFPVSRVAFRPTLTHTV